MAVKNSTILAKAYLEGSNDFQQRVPDPSVAGYQATVNALFDPYNKQCMNEFADMLVGLMGTYVDSKRFDNPLRELKKPAAEWGNTERHVAVKYLKAHSPNITDETLQKLEKPEFVEWFYSVNEHRRYEFSWIPYEMQRVFGQNDSYSFDAMLSATFDQMYSSDSYDEMTTMIEGFAKADANPNFTLYRNQITAAPTTKELGQELLVKIKTDAGRMKFPTVLYNQLSDIPVFETSDSLILWVTPEVDAQLDVYALAELFNVERAEVNFRKIVIPEFPIPNVYAALTSEDFLYIRDVWYGVEPPFYNAAQRSYKYYLYHDQMIGINPAANCVLYTTDAATEIPTIKLATTGMSFTTDTGEVAMGGTLDLSKYLELSGSVTPDGTAVRVEPNAAVYELAAMRDTTPIQLNNRTYVDNSGVLHVQKTGSLKSGDTITVTAKSVYTNPSGETPTYTATFTATVKAAETKGAKESFVSENPNLVYTSDGDDVTYTK